MEDSEENLSIKDRKVQPNNVIEPHKIHCEECANHDDCPRMRGGDYCLGAEVWARNKRMSSDS